MPKFQIILVAKVRAADVDEAHEVAGDAAMHLLETFNDDDGISPGIRYMAGNQVVVPAALLRTLIDATDIAADERERDAESMRRDGEHDNEKSALKDARQWRAAVRQALRIERASLPRKSLAKQRAELAARGAAA